MSAGWLLVEDSSGIHRRSWAHNLWEVNYSTWKRKKVEVKVQQEEVEDRERQ